MPRSSKGMTTNFDRMTGGHRPHEVIALQPDFDPPFGGFYWRKCNTDQRLSEKTRLKGVHPDLVKVIRRAAEITGTDFVVTRKVNA